MAKRDYFTFYRSFYEQISECNDPEARREMYEVLLDYAFNKNEPDFNAGTFNPITKFFWRGAEPILRKSWAQYENGCKGGAPQGNTNNKGKKKVNPKLTQSQPIKNKNKNIDEDIGIDIDEDIECEKEKGKLVVITPAFSPPTLEDVLSFYNSKHEYLGVNDESEANRFYNYYSARGWMMGQTPMRNWEAALEAWILKGKQFQPSKNQTDPRDKLNRDAVKAMAALAAQSQRPIELPF